MTQRLLWASTGTKNPQYRDVRYVEELIGPETINTVPPATLAAFRDHGRPESRLTADLDEAKAVLLASEQAGLSLNAITDRLLEEGLQSFREAFDQLLVAVESHSRGDDAVRLNGCSYRLPVAVAAEVQSSLKEWNDADRVRRLWSRDPSSGPTAMNIGGSVGWISRSNS